MSEERETERLLRSFLEVALHLAEDLEVHRVLEVIVHHARELTGAPYGAVVTVDEDGEVDEVVYGGLTDEEVASLPRPGAERGLAATVLRNRRAIRVDRLGDHEGAARIPEGLDVEAFVGVPLQHRRTLVGALYLAKTRGMAPFSPDDEALLASLGAAAAVAIQNARLLAVEKQRAARGALLQEIAWQVRHSLDVTDVLTEAVEALGKAAGVDRCYVRLVEDPGSSKLGAIEVEWDAPGVTPLEPHKAAQLPVGTAAALTRTTQCSEDVAGDPRFSGPESAHLLRAMLASGARAALSTPLEWGDELMGVMTFHSLTPRRWSESDRALIEAAAREVSVALYHARLYYEALDHAERLRAVDEVRSEFLSMVSHELRSPMTVVSGIAHILRWRGERLSSDARDELLETLEREARRLTRLVSEFLDLEAIEHGQIELQRESIDLADLAAEAMVDAGQAARTTLDILGEDTTVEGDRDRLKQVLLNLLGNAAKFSEDGTPIELTVDGRPDGVVVSVRDYGPGISPEDMDKLFQRFSRLDTTVRRTPGSGIGLYVSKHIVDLHNGEITVESEVGKGATFSVHLPRPSSGSALAGRRE